MYQNSTLNFLCVCCGQHDVFSRDLPMPDLPGKVTFSAPPAPAFRSAAPGLDPNALAGLEPLERQRIQNDQQQAKEMEEKLHSVGTYI
jgi:hypothetical protein